MTLREELEKMTREELILLIIEIEEEHQQRIWDLNESMELIE